MTRWSEEQVDTIIGLLLRWGVILSVTVVMAGGTWYLLRYGAAQPAYHVFRSEGHEGHPQALIQFGLLLLIATPIARVVFSIFAFAAQKDWAYVAITSAVLSILLYSLASAAI